MVEIGELPYDEIKSRILVKKNVQVIGTMGLTPVHLVLHGGLVCTVVVWSPSVGGVLKFKVDDSARGKSGLAGCGGVLHDTEGYILALFLVDYCGVKDFCIRNVALGVWWVFVGLNSINPHFREAMWDDADAEAFWTKSGSSRGQNGEEEAQNLRRHSTEEVADFATTAEVGYFLPCHELI
ncbi:hypothetical protein GQ457_13G011030 [Hibiscus cannabinus]